MRSRFLVLAAAGLAVVGCKSSGGGAPADGGDTGTLANCSAADDLISNFDADNSLAPVGGRQGGWYTYGDNNGHFATSSGLNIAVDEGNPACSPAGALHVKGTGFSMWGAAMGVDWRPRPGDGDGGYGDKMPYDASQYRGIAFWAKSSAPLDGVQVAFPDLYTDGGAPAHEMPDPAGGATPVCTDCRCIYNPQSALNCSPFLVQFGRKGDASADLVFSDYASYQLDT